MSEYQILNDRYYLEELLGSGGMAVVFRAQDLTLERKVAIKILREDFSRDQEFRLRFQQEAKAVAKLSHPNIVTVHDFGYQDDRLFIVMEYVPGSDLKAILKSQGKLDIDEALSLLIKASAGIGHAHRAGIVHCDIKPQNLLVTPDKQIKVVDFGIARALVSIAPDEKSDVVWGSPKYFSPEQASGTAPSPASDVYSLGVVLYEALTGQLPFQADSSEELANYHRETLPPSARQLNPLIPSKVDEFLMVVLSKDPAKRYRNADQMSKVMENLRLLLGYSPITEDILAMEVTEKPMILSQTQIVYEEELQPEISRPPVARINNLRQDGSKRFSSKEEVTSFDWITWLLILLTLIAVGGLIPYWLWVYYIIYPPVR